MRLNQFLAKSLGISRRQADVLIKEKKIKINDEQGQLFHKVSENDNIEVFEDQEWKAVGSQQKTQTILFYKPIFCITSKKDEFDRKTIYDHLPKNFFNLNPAGRLDYMSEGLLVLSNDGDFLYKLTHPKFEHNKVYLVGLKKELSKTDIEEIKKGLTIDDYKLNPVKVLSLREVKERDNREQKSKNCHSEQSEESFDYLKLQNNFFWYEFTLTEGRNNQIRKMCKALDNKVMRLIRTKHNDFELTEELYNKKFLEI